MRPELAVSTPIEPPDAGAVQFFDRQFERQIGAIAGFHRIAVQPQPAGQGRADLGVVVDDKEAGDMAHGGRLARGARQAKRDLGPG